MSTCVRCGTQFASGDPQCPFCALPTSSEADVTRAGPGPNPGWQQQPPQGQSWQQTPQGGPPWQQGPQGGGWQQGPPMGGPPWQQGPPMGGPSPSRGPKPAILIGAAVAAVIVLGLGTWGIAAAVSDDSDDDAPTASDTPSSTQGAEIDESEPTESESTEQPTPEGETEAGTGGSDRISYDLSDGEQSFALDVSDPGDLTIVAEPDADDDIILTINDPDGDELCREDSGLGFDDETCSFEADETGEYEIIVSVFLDLDGGQGEVVIE